MDLKTIDSQCSVITDKATLSWIFYDWANSAFATTVMAGFFPLFFKNYWSAGIPASESTLKLGAAHSIAGLILALLAPILGALSDVNQNKKKYLSFFMGVSVLATGCFYYVGQGQWQWAASLSVIATIGFTGGNIFYDSLLVNVSKGRNMDFISGAGYAIGYLGGGLLFAVNVLMFLKFDLFGIPSGVEAIKLSFVSVSVWWFVFSLPLFFNVKEIDTKVTVKASEAIKESFRRLHRTFQNIRQHKQLFIFLIAFLFYIDGVNTIVKMAVDFGLALGFESSSLITALLITQFVGFPAALGFGYFGQKLGPRPMIYVGLGIYLLVTLWGYFMNDVVEFYALAVVIGLVQGGVQALSRSLYASLIPNKEESGEYFGFFNMLGKFGAVLGPVLVGLTSNMTGSPRASILVIAVFFLLGGFLLWLSSHSPDKNPVHH